MKSSHLSMMSHCIKTHLALFKLISRSDEKLLKLILKLVDKKFVEAIVECCYNFLRGNIKISKFCLKRLNKHKSTIRNLCNKNSFRKKNQIILKKGHLFLIVLLKTIIKPLIEYLEKSDEIFKKNGSC